jgi:hypothetical protein
LVVDQPAEDGSFALPLGDVGGEILDVGLFDAGAVAGVGGEFARLLDDETRVGADPGQQQFHRPGAETRAEGARLGERHRHERFAGAVAFAADEGEIGVLLAPLGKRPAAIDRGGRDEHAGLVGVHGAEDLLQVLDQTEGALGAAGDGIGEEVDVLEPHDAPAAKHRDGLHGLAEAVHRGLDLAHVGGEAVDDLAGKFVGHRGGEGVEALAAGPADEEVVGPAKERELLARGHGRASGSQRGLRDENIFGRVRSAGERRFRGPARGRRGQVGGRFGEVLQTRLSPSGPQNQAGRRTDRAAESCG